MTRYFSYCPFCDDIAELDEEEIKGDYMCPSCGKNTADTKIFALAPEPFDSIKTLFAVIGVISTAVLVVAKLGEFIIYITQQNK